MYLNFRYNSIALQLSIMFRYCNCFALLLHQTSSMYLVHVITPWFMCGVTLLGEVFRIIKVNLWFISRWFLYCLASVLHRTSSTCLEHVIAPWFICSVTLLNRVFRIMKVNLWYISRKRAYRCWTFDFFIINVEFVVCKL